jgi:radical S-adenosyl methionine domain-containing protein 2
MKHNRIEAVNFHITSFCNMRCKFCFATFQDIEKTSLSLKEQIEIIDLCSAAGIQKLNFAGGEPTWVKHLPALLKYAKDRGLITSIISNGSRFGDEQYLGSILENLDILGVSIDSPYADTHKAMGRFDKRHEDVNNQLEWLTMARNAGCLVKVNTVVSKYNWQEDLTDIIREINPMRWKVFQALRVEGQNDVKSQDYLVSYSEFENFIQRHQTSIGSVPMIVEDNQLMTGSYLMISPDGRFYDDTKGKHTYSSPILEAGWSNAIDQINVDVDKFDLRDGRYYERL